MAIGYLAVLDYLRHRGEADSDTLSEVVRDTVARHPRGRQLFTAGLVIAAAGFHRHILAPLDR